MQGRSTWKSILPGEEMQWCFSTTLLLVSLLASLMLSCGANENHHQYCIVVAGPSGERVFDSPCLYFKSLGLQMGYFLQKAERFCIIKYYWESISCRLITLCRYSNNMIQWTHAVKGSFFFHYPRHRNIKSINNTLVRKVDGVVYVFTKDLTCDSIENCRLSSYICYYYSKPHALKVYKLGDAYLVVEQFFLCLLGWGWSRSRTAPRNFRLSGFVHYIGG